MRLSGVQKHLINWLTYKIASAKLLQCFREHSFGFRGDIVVFHVRHACLLSLFREALWQALAPSYIPFGETIYSLTISASYRSHVRTRLNWIIARPQHWFVVKMCKQTAANYLKLLCHLRLCEDSCRELLVHQSFAPVMSGQYTRS